MLELRFVRALLLAAVVFNVSGCVVSAVDAGKPELALPETWSQDPVALTAVPDPWWQIFSDPTLDRLMHEALSNNTDIAIAAARVLESRAIWAITNADRWPSLGLEGSATRNQESPYTSPFPGAGTPQTSYRVQGTVAYEMDLWGRYARAGQAERARLLASEYDREAVKLSLTGDVARVYFGLRAATQQLLRARETLAARTESLELERLRAEAGESDEATLRRSEAEEAIAAASVRQFEYEVAQRGHALAVLLGRPPQGIAASIVVAEADLPAAPRLPAGVPSAILERRPDIRAADAALLAAAADVGSARAALYPRINLTGVFGWASPELDDLFTKPAEAWSLVGGLVQPLFEGGRLRAGVDRAQALQLQAQAQYAGSVQSAFRDVLDALRGQEYLSQIRDANVRQVDSLSRAAELTELRYNEGEIGYLELLDVRRTLYQAQVTLVGSQRDALTNAVDLALALGGGLGERAEVPMTP